MELPTSRLTFKGRLSPLPNDWLDLIDMIVQVVEGSDLPPVGLDGLMALAVKVTGPPETDASQDSHGPVRIRVEQASEDGPSVSHRQTAEKLLTEARDLDPAGFKGRDPSQLAALRDQVRRLFDRATTTSGQEVNFKPELVGEDELRDRVSRLAAQRWESGDLIAVLYIEEDALEIALTEFVRAGWRLQALTSVSKLEIDSRPEWGVPQRIVTYGNSGKAVSVGPPDLSHSVSSKSELLHTAVFERPTARSQ